MSESIRFCVDCKHVRFSRRYGEQCTFKAIRWHNPVTGKVDPDPIYTCSYERADPFQERFKTCGPEGKNFEPKPPRKTFLQRLLARVLP